MQEELKILLQIQERDLEILDLERRSKRLPQELAAIKAEQENAKLELANRKEFVKELQVAHKSLELELDTELENIKKNETMLVKIKTNEEYKAIQNQIKDLKYKASLIEDKILQQMEDIETAKRTVKEAEQKTALIQVKLQQQEKEVREQLVVMEQRSLLLAKEKQELKTKLAEDFWQAYDRILRNKAGVAVVPIENGVCQGCYMKLPPNEINEVRKAKELIRCENCARILFWPE